ncbi:hypothetical protein [Brachyspira pilosicoli]|uniref:hypothetical protein n=1 Tax=Brachyspira pilosicoli TaxID=52584 RepID=UPI00255CFAF6|nr:hypothetical protein [Brachyspira pilosicoli]
MGIPLNLAIYIIRNTYFILTKKRAISMAPKHMENVMNIASIIVLIIIILSIAMFIYIIKKKPSIYLYVLNISLFLFGILLISFFNIFSQNTLLSYYYMSLIFFIVYVAEFIKTAVYFMTSKSSIKIK